MKYLRAIANALRHSLHATSFMDGWSVRWQRWGGEGDTNADR